MPREEDLAIKRRKREEERAADEAKRSLLEKHADLVNEEQGSHSYCNLLQVAYYGIAVYMYIRAK